MLRIAKDETTPSVKFFSEEPGRIRSFSVVIVG